MAARKFANAPATTLDESCTSGATSIVVAAVTGLPITYPYIMILDKGTASEEVVLVTNASGTTLTVTRGYDSTSAFAHSAGASAVHGISAIDAREANDHVNASSAVHGLTGAVVGTTDTQTVTNKTISGTSNTINGFTASKIMESDGTGKLVASSRAFPTGALVGDTDTQTVTNKTISADSNTLSGIAASSFVLSNGSGNIDGAAAQKAIPAGVVVGTTDTQTLDNKTLTSPTITGAGQVLRAFKSADETVTSSTTLQDDDHLTVAIPAAGHYMFSLVLFNEGISSADMKLAMAFTGTVTAIRYGVQGREEASSSVGATLMQTGSANASGTAIAVGTGAADGTITLDGMLHAGGAGTLKLQWAQQTSNASGVTLRALSWMRVERVD